jgi:hypothetical protein
LRKAQSDDKKVAVQSNKNMAYIANLNEDPMLSYIICHYLDTDEITIGSRQSTICLTGLSILERHAIIRRQNNHVYELLPAEAAAKLKVNGYSLNRLQMSIDRIQH